MRHFGISTDDHHHALPDATATWQMAQRLDEELSEDECKAWQGGSVKEWADESVALTTKYVYPLPENHEISEDYSTRALP